MSAKFHADLAAEAHALRASALPVASPGVTRIGTQFSPGFATFLLRHRIGVAASTYQTGHVLFFGVRAGGEPVASAAGFNRAMGLAASSQRLYVGGRAEVWRLENALRADELENETFDRLYAPRECRITGDINIHEIAVEDGGRVVFANTRFSCLATFSDAQAFKPLWKPAFVSRLAPEDRCHLNGLALDSGRVRYVTCCSTSDSLEGWRERRASGGVLVDIAEDRILADGLSMPHSPRLRDGALWMLESGRGVLTRRPREGGAAEDVTFCPGFARGLAFVDRFALTTISLPRPADFDGLPAADAMRRRGAAPWRGVLVIDTRNGDIVEWVRLEGGVSELFDLAVIPDIRAARGLGPNALEMADLVRGEHLP